MRCATVWVVTPQKGQDSPKTQPHFHDTHTVHLLAQPNVGQTSPTLVLKIVLLALNVTPDTGIMLKAKGIIFHVYPTYGTYFSP